MAIFDSNETTEFIATQNFHYDSYSGCQCYLERVDVHGKCGLVCVEKAEDGTEHAIVVLKPVYNDITVKKISTARANFDSYLVFANGNLIGRFTMVINEWIPVCHN